MQAFIIFYDYDYSQKYANPQSKRKEKQHENQKKTHSLARIPLDGAVAVAFPTTEALKANNIKFIRFLVVCSFGLEHFLAP